MSINNNNNKTFYIYKIVCNDILINETYVGSTNNFKLRKNNHKCSCSDGRQQLYKYIRNNGGWENWDMVLLEQFECDDKKKLLLREFYYQDLLNAKLNQNIPGRTQKEYYNLKKKIKKELIKFIII